MLEVRAFGSVRATLDGTPVDLGGPRQRAVLGMLVATGGRTVSTDRFLEELWSGEPPPSATGALQAYVSRLRSALEPARERRRPASVLVSNPPGYALARPVEQVDTWRFSDLVRRAAGLDDQLAVDLLDEALGLWTDDPFAEYLDQEWAATEATRLREQRAEAVELRATALLRLGRGGQVIPALEEHVRAHPLREQPVALLARAYYQSGRQAEALAVLASLRERLVDELGVDPGPELRQLESDVLRQADHLAAPVRPEPSPATHRPPAPTAPRSSSEGPLLIGREDELARLATAAEQVRHRAGVVWVEGDAGFGKSAVVSRFADQSVGSWSAVRGHCSEVAGAPTGHAWLEVLDGLDVPRPGRSDAFALADAVRLALQERGARTLLLLEDVHRADDETLQVLWHLLEATEAPVLVVATFRSHEVGRDLAAALALTTERTHDRIVLGGLDPRAAREVLAHHVDAALPDAVWRRLVERSAGNPLFLRQLAQLVGSEGIASVDTVPVAIRDLLLRRIERLPQASVDALSRASVLGRDIDFDLVLAFEQEWGDADEDALANHLDAGLVAGLLDSPRPAELRFTHALIRDTFYGRLPPLRRTRLHRAALAAYRKERPDRTEEIAHHAAESLDRRTAAEAVPLLLAAAERNGYAGAVPHLRTALRALELAGADPRDSFGVRLELVRALARDGNSTAAVAERRLAVEEATAHGTVLDVARAWQWQSPMMWTRRASDRADGSTIAELRGLLTEVGDRDPALRIELLNALVIEADPWNIDVVVDAAAEATALAAELGDPELECRALNAAYFGVLAADHPDLLGRIGSRLLEVAGAADLHGYAAVAHMHLHSAAIAEADLGTAGAHIEAAVRAGTSGQLPELLLLSSIFEATTLLLQSDLDGAREGFERICEVITASGDPNGFYIWLWSRFAIDFAGGDTSALHEHAVRMTEMMPWHSRDLVVVTLLDAGDRDGARAAWSPTPMQHDATWLFDVAVRAHIVHELDDVEQARVVYDAMLPWSGQLTRSLNGALSMGPVDHYLGLLALTLGDRALADHHLERAQRLTGPGQATTWDRTWVRTPSHLRS
ncbi:DNA-binding SARP family transcriptional activator/type II secretory pathway predicted ATPase ExeA [Nocardioides cavernae]|uniref:DNA-binding SARP family transcriptional activator/type II secretory pathway predicted ATPase ExeA n=1 Tax=Nocardioides cavernae TaxID=1921566 RepID=A0A7Y9H153_9ACTN|nr:BTAD domain-containing putative transcriptional regulator [Nocardioides cavernae]NYE36008.1 DNA-binding SARP family transcriptional activator/type II secretory pathway predicted ATPase ExeA [Nocardioides cavernae]